MTDRARPALHTKELHKSFRHKNNVVKALDGVSVTAHQGRITTILGTNGAGKSTLLGILQGLERPDSGEVKVFDQNPWNAGAEHRARVGVMLQETGLPPAAKPVEFLHHLSKFYANPLPVPELCARLGIDAFASRSIRRLSGGERQRVALAAAVVGRPRLCMLDEPSAGLDPLSRIAVVEFIEQLRAEGMSILLTTHLLDDAERLSDAVYILTNGRVRHEGSVRELTIASAGHHLVLKTPLEAKDQLETFTQAASREGILCEQSLSGEVLTLRANGRFSPALLALAAQCGEGGSAPISLNLAQTNLTELFMQTALEDTQ